MKNIVQCSNAIFLTAKPMNNWLKNLTVQGIKLQGLYLDYKTNFSRKSKNTKNIHCISIKLALIRNRMGAFFMLYFRHKELIPININEYIKSKKELKNLPIMVVYLTIIELVKDGYIKYDNARIIKKDV